MQIQSIYEFWQIMRRDTLYGNMAGICIIIVAYMPLWHTNGRYLFVQHNKKIMGIQYLTVDTRVVYYYIRFMARIARAVTPLHEMVHGDWKCFLALPVKQRNYGMKPKNPDQNPKSGENYVFNLQNCRLFADL